MPLGKETGGFMMPKKTYTFRLSSATINDLDLLASKLQSTRVGALRFLINKGFMSLGNWRKEKIIYRIGDKSV